MSIKKSKQQRLTKKAKADLRKVQTLLNEQIEIFDSTPNEKKRLRSMLNGSPGASCMLYIKEANGETKNVAFDEVKNNHTIDETIEIWESSFDHDTSTLARYFAGFDHITNHMIGEGLLNEDGSATDKGKLLQEQDEDELNEELLNELETILEQEPGEGEEVEEKKPGMLRRAAGAVGKVVSAPFKLLKWFRDKIWGLIEGAITKAFGLIKSAAAKFDIKWLQTFTSAVEGFVDKVKAFCDKNKVISFMCGIVKGILIAYAVKFAVIGLLNAFGINIGALMLAAASGQCAAGAVQGAVSENQVLNEAEGELCNAAAKAGKVASDFAMRLVKGAIKYIGSSGGFPTDMVTKALNFVDKYDTIIDQAGMHSVDMSQGTGILMRKIDMLEAAARKCGSDGTELVIEAIKWVKYTAGKLPADAFAKMAEKLVQLGDAGSKISNFDALARVLAYKDQLKGIEKSPEAAAKIIERLTELGNKLGFDNIGKPYWSHLSKMASQAQGGAGRFVGQVARKAGLQEHQISRFQHLAKVNG